MKKYCFRAPLFIDATGDGWVGYWAGADWRMGREAKSEYGEEFGLELTEETAQKLCSILR